MSACWLAFARSGDRNNVTVPHWPTYDLSQRATMVFDAIEGTAGFLQREAQAAGFAASQASGLKVTLLAAPGRTWLQANRSTCITGRGEVATN